MIVLLNPVSEAELDKRNLSISPSQPVNRLDRPYSTIIFRDRSLNVIQRYCCVVDDPRHSRALSHRNSSPMRIHRMRMVSRGVADEGYVSWEHSGNHRIDADCHHYRHPNGLRLVCVPLYASPTDKVAPQPHAEEPSFAAFTSTQKTRSRHSSASGALSRYVCKLVPPYSAASRYD
ncbi:hypothetical protein SeMB42_g02921 [Synchytrium endobioticum]|uniref:Uncharacterized protein n=1 Tax=Synchytrium endobioticum TaxID=286115 RepID=A0A507DAN2_9FUNG|nr:hypothetical protein SeMB42_g02921 [Synchytrium endobioticum]